MEISLARKESWKRSLISCWRFISLRKSRSGKGWRLELFLPRIIFLAFFFGVFCYVLAVIALYTWRSNVPQNQVRFVDIALPWNWPGMNERLSMTNLRQAEQNLEEHKFKEAWHEVNAAVRRYPANFEARLLMGRLMAASNPEGALQILRAGYRFGYPEQPDYAALFLALALRLEDFEALSAVLPTMIDHLAKQPETEENKRRIESYFVVLLQAQMRIGNYVGALRALDDVGQYKLQMQTLPIRLLVLSKMGSFTEFDQLVSTLPLRERDSGPILMLRAQAAYERGDIEGAQTYIGRALAGNQQQWSTYMDGIKLLLRMGQVRKAEEYVDLYLYYNGNNQQAIQRLAAALTDWPSSYLVGKIKLWSLASNSQMYPMLLFYEVQALFREGKFHESKERYDNWVQYVPQNHRDYRYVEAYAALFDMVLAESEGARQRLLDTLAAQVKAGNPFQEEVYWVAADALRKMARFDLAEAIINQGVSVYPNTLTLPKLRKQVREDRAAAATGGIRPSSRSQSSGWELDLESTLPQKAGAAAAAAGQAVSNDANGIILNVDSISLDAEPEAK